MVSFLMRESYPKLNVWNTRRDLGEDELEFRVAVGGVFVGVTSSSSFLAASIGFGEQMRYVRVFAECFDEFGEGEGLSEAEIYAADDDEVEIVLT